MDSFVEWRNWFKQKYGDIRNNFVRHEDNHQRVISLFKYTKHNGYQIGVLIDIYRSSDQRESFSAAGATFSKAEGILHVGVNIINFEYENSQTPIAGAIRFRGAQKMLPESVSGYLEYKVEDSRFLLTSLELNILFWHARDKEYRKVACWDQNSYFEAEADNLLCIDCFGEGTYKKMSIPREDYKSGLSGYALYSSNRINGIFGCKKCGGEGAKLEQWYILENEEVQQTTVPLKKGKGARHVPYEGPFVEIQKK